MRLTKRQLKRIIREEYSRLKRRGLIREMGMPRGGMCDGAEEVIANAEKHFEDGYADFLMNHWREVLKPFGSDAIRWLNDLEAVLGMEPISPNYIGPDAEPQFNQEDFEEFFSTGMCDQAWCDALYG